MGQKEAANELLQQLYDEKNRDDETLGLFASVQKDLACSASTADAKSGYMAMGAYYYAKSFERSHNYWTGINAATLRFVEGKREEAIALARMVYDDCRQRFDRSNPGEDERYWLVVTLGEAALILGKAEEAKDWYAQGAEEGRRRYGDLLSTRRNLRLLAGPLGKEVESIFALFHLPRVVAFVGHLVDRPGRPKPRFPMQLEGAVRDAIRERLAKINAGFGFSAAACGADILFLEALRERGAETNVVLPFGEDQFVKESVAVVPGSDWEARFKESMKAATGKFFASGQKLVAGTTSFEYVGQLLIGLASLRASQMETELVPLTVWDGNPGDGGGGTADTVAYWHSLGHKVELINLSEILRQQFPEQAVLSERTGTIRTPAPGPAPELGSRICSLLFADAVGFSKLTEEEVPHFVEHFLGLVARLTAEQRDPPLLKNTWGDGLYFVFSDVREAGVFALELCDRVKATKWSEKGLRNLNLRIGLHAGPVYCGVDPVMAQKNYFGTHVSRAARIEPITQPGHVYASQPFAALAAARQVKEFDCLYVGQIAQAKDFGMYATYVLQRTTKQYCGV
jgi:class 3 adenylate cyclase